MRAGRAALRRAGRRLP
ncbi:hypothetical protein, partial [Paraburkholderia piptadeniae]